MNAVQGPRPRCGTVYEGEGVKSILSALRERVLVCDGAMGTQLQALGLPPDACHEQWNVDQPDRVRSVHQRYLEAGAEIILTNTFGANRVKLGKRDLAARTDEFNRSAVALALESAADRAYVLGDIGPTGELIDPLGTLSPEAAQAAFAEQVAALAAAGVHAILIETMMSVEEATLAVTGARQACGLPVLASMTFQKGRGGYRTLMGETVQEAAQQLEQAGAQVIGTNCGGGTEDALAIVNEMAQHTRQPLLAEPNAGVPSLEGARTVFKESPDQWAQRLPALLAANVRIVGGCCGTTPDHIRRVRDLVNGGTKNSR